MISLNEEKFNEWYNEMQRVIAPYPGLLSKEVFLPVNEADQVTTILRFDKMENAEKWMYSEQRLGMLQNASARILTDINEGVHTKNLFWFNEVSDRNGGRKWKQVMVTFVAVFPLTLIVPRFVSIFVMLSCQITGS